MASDLYLPDDIRVSTDDEDYERQIRALIAVCRWRLLPWYKRLFWWVVSA